MENNMPDMKEPLEPGGPSHEAIDRVVLQNIPRLKKTACVEQVEITAYVKAAIGLQYEEEWQFTKFITSHGQSYIKGHHGLRCYSRMTRWSEYSKLKSISQSPGNLYFEFGTIGSTFRGKEMVELILKRSFGTFEISYMADLLSE